MALERLKIQDFRNIARAQLVLAPGLNVISGANGSGKTSLLEAIYFLGRGASFRTQRVQSLIRKGKGELVVFGEVRSGEEGSVGIGIRRSMRELEVRIGGEKAPGLSALAARLPLLVINPDSHRLVEQGPKQRRQFVDWGVFHVEHDFHGAWLRYMRALRQRNAALRSSAPTSAKAWDGELVTHGTAIHEMRERYLRKLLPLLPEYVGALAPLGALEVAYQQGWPGDEALGTAIGASFERDRAVGHTRYGPHRADLAIRIDGVAAEESVSRGQQKLLVAGMRLAQARLLAEESGRAPVVLVDDLPAELDRAHREAMIGLLLGLGGQLFITAIDADMLELPAEAAASCRMFHVEHGAVSEVI